MQSGAIQSLEDREVSPIANMAGPAMASFITTLITAPMNMLYAVLICWQIVPIMIPLFLVMRVVEKVDYKAFFINKFYY